MFKLGKKPARAGAVKLKLGSYLDAAELPPVPAIIGDFARWPQAWRMLNNDTVGCCVEAGAAHETMLLKADAGYPAPLFSNSVVLKDYADCGSGYVVGNEATDQGTDVQQYAAYRQKTGILDASGQRHKIDYYAALKAGDVDEIALGAFLFGAVGIGVLLPTSAMDQFNRFEPWSVVSGGGSEGGHYFPIIGRNSLGNWICVTWGRLQAITSSWLTQYMDEGVAFLSLERLNAKGLSPQGFDLAGLQAYYQKVTA
jgi:hypothetical protein